MSNWSVQNHGTSAKGWFPPAITFAAAIAWFCAFCQASSRMKRRTSGFQCRVTSPAAKMLASLVRPNSSTLMPSSTVRPAAGGELDVGHDADADRGVVGLDALAVGGHDRDAGLAVSRSR